MAIEERKDESVQQEAKCETPLEALKAFKEAQERRVAHWKEYDEALEHYEKTNLNAQDGQGSIDLEPVPSHSDAQAGHRCGPMNSSRSTTSINSTEGNSHYHSVALPMTDAIFNKIIALVTSGLLDCSHSVRTIETELRTALQRPDLAKMVGKVQDLENEILRKIVERDQNKRISKVEGRDLIESINDCNRIIQDRREKVQESIEEITAEMVEL